MEMLSKLNPIKWCHFQHQLKYFAVVQNKRTKIPIKGIFKFLNILISKNYKPY